MNEIFENNKFTTRAHNFYNLYRTPIIAIVVILLITVVLFLAIGQISKSLADVLEMGVTHCHSLQL